MFPSKGETTAPWGVPTFVSFHSPSSDTPAFSHFWIRRITRRSAIRCSTNFTSHSCETLSKNPRTSRSSTQFTFFRLSPTANASRPPQRGPRLAAPRPDPIRESQKVLFVDLVENRHHGLLDYLVLQRGDP